MASEMTSSGGNGGSSSEGSGGSSGSSGISSRFQFASQSAMLFAHFVDDYEVRQFCTQLTQACEASLGGRLAVLHKAELTLLSRLLYYLTSLVACGRTPGQAFCDFVLIKESGGVGGGSSGRTGVLRLRIGEQVALAVLQAGLPYLLERRGTILGTVKGMWDLLCSKEDLSSVEETGQALTGQGLVPEVEGAGASGGTSADGEGSSSSSSSSSSSKSSNRSRQQQKQQWYHHQQQQQQQP